MKRFQFGWLMLAVLLPVAASAQTAEEHFDRGNAEFEAKNYQAAIPHYTESLRLNPNNGAAFSNRGICYYTLLSYRLALSDFTEAIRFEPEDADNYYYRGVCRHYLQDYTGALEDYTKTLLLNPN